MHDRGKDIVIRKLFNEAAYAYSQAEYAACIEYCRLIIDRYIGDKDLNTGDLDILQKLKPLCRLVGMLHEILLVNKREREIMLEAPFNMHDSNEKAPEPLAASDTQPIQPSQFTNNQYHPSWYDSDFFFDMKNVGHFPEHECKLTWLTSLPFVSSFRTAIDIGCRFGIYSRFLGQHFERVVAFDPRKFEEFQYNVDLTNIVHYCCALGDETTHIDMYYGTHQQIEGEMARHPCFRLDEFNLQDVDYIKIDVEGFEEKVIRGGLKTINKFSPIIVIEQNDVCLPGDDKYAAKHYLESLGYTHVASDPKEFDLIMQRL